MPESEDKKYLDLCIPYVDRAARWSQYKAAQAGPRDLSQSDLSNQDLKEFNFTDTNLAAANLFNTDLSGSDLSRANLSYANLGRANLANCFLTGANLNVADLRGINAVDANFDMADLTHVKLNGAWLVGCSMAESNLEGADLRGANLKYANLMNARLGGANVEEADLTGVDLSAEQKKSLVNFHSAIILGGRPSGAKEPPKSKLKAQETHDDLFAEEDCYKILEISPEASLDEIERAYKQKAKEYHPDRVHHLGEKLRIVAQREFERIQHAYRSLSQHKANPEIAMESALTDLIRKKKSADLTIDDYLMLIRDNPDNEKLHYNLGLLYFKKGFVDLAIQEYEQALRINPYSTYALHNLRLAKLLKVLSGEKA
ncbi:MAG TPA: pentapeptide repeat-containing protein [Candidatus Sumerlaeota bacterium]|nr:pentapeptide repeat-containing protein [Candidatus Sumerlaeota bacterium]